MIDLYASPTPNVLKIEIMLEETGLEYRLKPINVWKGQQFDQSFVSLNPNSKVPVIIDYDHLEGPQVIFESIAILFYLAEKTGTFLPKSGAQRHEVMQWLVFQAANLGPANGQFNHFQAYAGPGNDYALSRYTTELRRLYDVMNRRLLERPYLGGAEFSIADIASLPWVIIQAKRLGVAYYFLDAESGSYPGIAAWVARCRTRPGVARGLTIHQTLDSGLSGASADDLDRIFGRGPYSYARGSDKLSD